MKSATKDWIGGAVSAVMGAIAPAIPVTYIAPDKFNFHDGITNLGVLCVYPVITALSAYLYRRPLPGIEENVLAAQVAQSGTSGTAASVVLAFLGAAAALALSACITPS